MGEGKKKLKISIMGDVCTGKEALAVLLSRREIPNPEEFGIHRYDQPLDKMDREVEVAFTYWAGRQEYSDLSQNYSVDVGILLYSSPRSLRHLLDEELPKFYRYNDTDKFPIIAVHSRYDLHVDICDFMKMFEAISSNPNMENSLKVALHENARKYLSPDRPDVDYNDCHRSDRRWLEQDADLLKMSQSEKDAFFRDAKAKLEGLGLVHFECSSFLYHKVDEIFEMACNMAQNYHPDSTSLVTKKKDPKFLHRLLRKIV